ncbi:MAG: phosphoribosylformylglycinamidine synthase subunit PurL [Candidatus Zixiibacteriota bacterium]
MKVNFELAAKLGLSQDEYNNILKVLGRIPTFTEIGVYSVMWSEHCSYKSSKPLLKTFPKKSDRLLAEPGAENAGALAIDDKWAVVFKAESHNHPSAISPFQGAATGVGGILRDIFAMGARPVALLDSLRFGNLEGQKTQFLFDGIISGISHYGNCIGVPIIGGEIDFEESYTINPLVNVMCVGLVERDKLTFAKAEEVGATVIYVGAATGRDGIHGATFASVELSEHSEKNLPSVQIGDPFLEKLLLEAILEIVEKELALAIQDMGAAGLTSSSTEMAHSGGLGMELNLDKVPVREKDMNPYEMLLSESQERMLLIAKPGLEKEIEAIFEKWDLHYAEIGYTTSTGNFVCLWHGDRVVDIPLESLVGDGVPVLDMKSEKPTVKYQDFEFSPCASSISNLMESIVEMPSVASKQYVYRQYDYQVGANTVGLPGKEAGIIRIKGSEKFISATIDCKGSYNYLDPYEGAKIAVAESIRNIISTGAIPIGITDCLNYGNPNKPQIYWAFSQGIKGISAVCGEFEIPVTGGNVSFYNESISGAVFPTPVIGTVGIIDDEDHITSPDFKKENDLIAIIGNTKKEFGGSIYQKYLFESKNIESYPIGKSPVLDTKESKKNAFFILDIIKSGLINSCHDLSDGGFFIALLESAILGDRIYGIDLELSKLKLSEKEFLFSESQSRYLISFDKKNKDELEKFAKDRGVSFKIIGRTTLDATIKGLSEEINLEKLSNLYRSSIENKLKTKE